MRNKVLKRVISILLCVSMFCFVPVLSFASGGFFVTASNILDLISELKSLWETVNPLLSAVNKANTEARFADECTVISYWRKLLKDYPMSKDEFVSFCTVWYSGDYDTISAQYGTDCLSHVESVYDIISRSIIYFGGIEGLAERLYSVETSDYNITDGGTVQVPSSCLVDFVNKANTLTTPKGKDLFIQSFRSDSRWRSFERVNNHGALMQNPYIPLFDDTQKTQLKDLWLVPFYQDENSVQYYSDYQFHLYYVPNDDPNSDIALQMDLYKSVPEFGNLLQTPYSGIVGEFTSGTVPLSIVFNTYLSNDTNMNRGISKLYILSFDDYLNGEITNTLNFTGYLSEEYLPKEIFQYKTSDGSKTLDIYKGATDFPAEKFEMCLEKSTAALNEDIGFICSHSLIERTYKDIDTSKIPSNQVINITGDTIYDYSITNPETGQTSTINNYITNNYNYPALPTTSGGGSGGGTGGDVNVTGSIGVHGDVGVDVTVSVPDININVNQGNGAGGNGGNINDYVDTSGDVDVGGIISKLPQLSKGFTDYLRGFFTWLPPEIYALIILILVIYVWKALASRR